MPQVVENPTSVRYPEDAADRHHRESHRLLPYYASAADQ